MKKKLVLFAAGLGLMVGVDAQTNVFPATGNVGIGTTTPITQLQVNVQTDGNLGIRTPQIAGITNGVQLNSFSDNGNINLPMEFKANQFLWSVSGSEKMRINENGNVGIGITSPTSLLTLRNSSLANDALTGSVDLSFATTSDGWGTRISTYKETSNTAGLAFYTQYGWSAPFERMRISATGNVGIGTTSPQNTLDVNGTIHAREVKVDLTGWSDFVFAPAYKLKTLTEVEQYIKTNGHLPEIPSTQEVEQKGVNVGDMQAKLLQKVEELTLYVIEQQKQIEFLKKENEKKSANNQ